MVARETDDKLAKRCKLVRESYLGISSTREMERRLKEAGRPITAVTIQRYENGERWPSADYLQALAEMADLDANWLLTGEGSAKRIPATAKEEAFDRMAEFMERERAKLSRAAAEQSTDTLAPKKPKRADADPGA